MRRPTKRKEMPADAENDPSILGEAEDSRFERDFSDLYELRFCKVCETPLPLDKPGNIQNDGDEDVIVCDRCYRR